MVEPFLIETKFRMPLGNSEAFLGNGTASYLKMSEMYSLEHWNELSGEQNIPPDIMRNVGGRRPQESSY